MRAQPGVLVSHSKSEPPKALPTIEKRSKSLSKVRFFIQNLAIKLFNLFLSARKVEIQYLPSKVVCLCVSSRYFSITCQPAMMKKKSQINWNVEKSEGNALFEERSGIMFISTGAKFARHRHDFVTMPFLNRCETHSREYFLFHLTKCRYSWSSISACD